MGPPRHRRARLGATRGARYAVPLEGSRMRPRTLPLTLFRVLVATVAFAACGGAGSRSAADGRSGLHTYDPGTRAHAQPVSTYNGETLKTSTGADASFDALGYANHLVYFPPTDTFYYFVRGAPVATYALKLDRADPKQSTLDELTTTGPTSPHGEPAYAYDSVNQIIGGAVEQNTFYAFNPATNVWSNHAIKGGSPGSEAFHALGYDPVNNVFIFVTDYDSGQKTWAFRLKS
jgi:hypothetical protein